MSLWTPNTREALAFFVGATLLVIEVVFLGARPHVLPFLLALMLSPIGWKIEKVRRENGIGEGNRL